jgi:hypothetical protein
VFIINVFGRAVDQDEQLAEVNSALKEFSDFQYELLKNVTDINDIDVEALYDTLITVFEKTEAKFDNSFSPYFSEKLITNLRIFTLSFLNTRS